jgi:hypothetical protein
MTGLTDVDDTARLLLSILQGPVGIYKIRTVSNSFAARERTPPLRGRPGSRIIHLHRKLQARDNIHMVCVPFSQVFHMLFVP